MARGPWRAVETGFMGRSAEPAAEGTGRGGSWRLVVSLGQVARAQEAPGGRAGVAFCCRGPAPSCGTESARHWTPRWLRGGPPRSWGVRAPPHSLTWAPAPPDVQRCRRGGWWCRGWGVHSFTQGVDAALRRAQRLRSAPAHPLSRRLRPAIYRGASKVKGNCAVC